MNQSSGGCQPQYKDMSNNAIQWCTNISGSAALSESSVKLYNGFTHEEFSFLRGRCT